MFNGLFLDDAPQSPLLREALKAHGVDTEMARPDLLRLADARCRRCEDADACFAWFTGMREQGAFRWFCPNASLFDGLPKTAAKTA